MPGTNYNFENALVFDLPAKYRDIAKDMLWHKSLGDIVFLFKNIDKSDVQEEYKIDNPLEWTKLLKAVMIAKITSFEPEICSKKELSFLLLLTNETMFENTLKPAELSASFQNKYPNLTSWLFNATHRHSRIAA